MKKKKYANKKKKKKRKINDLPSEIIIEILSRMPVDSVLQCKHVCRSWRFLIEHDPTFLALHTHRFITSSPSSGGRKLVIKSAPAAAFSFFMLVNRVNSRNRYYNCIYDNNELYFGEFYNNEKKRRKTVILRHNSIPSDRFHRLLTDDNNKCISSCNGLILIASISHNNNSDDDDDDDDADMFVFNPVTREYVHLPRPPHFEKYHHDGGGIGFGYHPITNEYKVVRITSSSSENGISVYTLGSGIWRKSKGETKTNINLGGGGGGGGGNNNTIYHLRWDAHPAVLLNGVLHWPTNQYGYGGILSFDLADEELKIFPLPPLEQHSDRIHHLTLGVLGGCLCWSTASVSAQPRVDIWVLNKLEEEDHNQEYSTTAAASCSWTKKYSLSTVVGFHGGEYKIVADLGGGKILFSRFDHFVSKFSLVSNDPNVEKRWLGTVGSNRWSTTMINRLPAMIPYMKSFVSLKALGEVVGL